MMSYVSRSTIFLMQYQTTCVDVDHSDEPHVPSTVPARVAQLWITTDLFARSWCLTWIRLQMDLVVGGTTTEHIGHGRDGWLAVEDDRGWKCLVNVLFCSALGILSITSSISWRLYPQ